MGNENESGVVGAVDRVSTGVVNALGPNPGLLVLILLNCLMICAAAYFLIRLEEYRHEERKQIVERCWPASGEPRR